MAIAFTLMACVCQLFVAGWEARAAVTSCTVTVMETSILSPPMHTLHLGISKTLLSNITLCTILLAGLMNGVSN